MPHPLIPGEIIWSYNGPQPEITPHIFLCRNCKQPFSLDSQMVRLEDQRCSNCNIEGKVYPKKREAPREAKIIEITENEELEQIILQVLSDNPKPVADYKNGKKQAIGFLIGCILKKTGVNPAEVKSRLELKIGSEKS